MTEVNCCSKPFRDGDCVPGRALGQRCHCAADVDEELRYKRIALAFKLLEHAMHDAELADILDGTAVVLKRAEEV